MNPESWWLRADCRTQDSRLWFPERGEPAEPARAICAECPVVAECREYGLSHTVLGIWGGLSEKQRISIRRKQRVSA